MRSIRRIKGSSISFVVLFLLMTGYANAQDDTIQQVEATFRVRSAFTKFNGISFAKFCEEPPDQREIFISKNGVAYLYYGEKNADNGIWDSVEVTSDTADMKEMKNIITKSFIDSMQAGCNKCPDTQCGYFLYINTDGFTNSFTALDIETIKKYKALMNRLQPLIKILDRVYKKYKN